MNERLKKALKRQSELREAMNWANGKKEGADGYLAPDKLAEHQGELVKLEVEIRAALDEPETRTDDGEFVRLRDRVDARAFINAAIEDRAITEGPEAELLQELKLPDSNVMPWAAIEDRQIEDRQDAVTPVPDTAIGQPRQPILTRVFHRTDAAFVGASMPTVPRGLPVYPVMTGGAAGAMVAPGVEQDAEAAAFVGQNVAPKRATARYLFRAEDAARFEGLESTLRSDLRLVMGGLIDRQAINGDGAGANLAGFISHAAAGANPPGTAAGVIDLAKVDSAIALGVDGLYASGPEGVRFLIGIDTMRRALQIRPESGAGIPADRSLYAHWQDNCGGVRASSRVAAQSAGQGGQVQSAYRFVPNGLRFIVPVWEGVELIRDPYTGAAKGEVALTVIALYGALMVRNNGVQEVKFKLSHG